MPRKKSCNKGKYKCSTDNNVNRKVSTQFYMKGTINIVITYIHTHTNTEKIYVNVNIIMYKAISQKYFVIHLGRFKAHIIN